MKPSVIIQKSKDVLGGTPVFMGTRVPAQTLLDYLESGSTVDGFLEDFPTVSKSQAIDFLESLKEALMESPHESPLR